ncbi:hypothetical protein [Niveispirillum irakense]|uniref:hypothetical protein n=1 Tax=Niveispirillum irakense TaxID=34011 RepID=UPI0003F5A303|nr:hypothetical protein [Niveispirillum irakense]
MNELLPSLLILAGGSAGAWALRRSWRQGGGGGRLPWLLSGWVLLIASLLIPAWVLGTVRGPFIALALVPVAALFLVASGFQVRMARAGRATGRESLAPEPSERASTTWRTVLRWLLAGPIGMVAALAIGIAYAVWMPGAAQTRLVVGGLLVPLVWGGAMAWTLADNRIIRATAVLVGTALVGFTASILKGFA